MKPLAQLVLPAVRWDRERGYEAARPAVESALDLGVGGFILFGGEREAVRNLTRELRAASRVPLLVASDLERGAGQQIGGLTPLPPLGALSRVGESAVRDAARLTAREALSVGINWVFAPVLDLDVEPANPIVQTRAFDSDPAIAAALGESWVAGCQGEGALACAKHFPGHGRTLRDSHSELAVVAASRALLRDDLAPFEAAVGAGVASIMTAHVAYPALDPSGLPATFSRPIVSNLLRRELGFEGLLVTDALVMEGARAAGSETKGGVRALAAGCDLLLYPEDPAAVAAALERAVSAGDLERAAVDRALSRRHAALERVGAAAAAEPPEGELRELAGRLAPLPAQCVSVLRGSARTLGPSVHIEVVDDDAGGPYQLSSRTVVAKSLWAAGIDVRPDGEPLVLLFADVKSWKNRAGLSDVSRQRLAHLLSREATVVLFGHPRRLVEIPGRGTVLCAWSGDEVMQRAAAERLLKGGAAVP